MHTVHYFKYIMFYPSRKNKIEYYRIYYFKNMSVLSLMKK